MKHKSIALGACVGLLLYSSGGLTALAASPAVVVSGGSTPLSTLSVSGTGFAANEPVHVMLSLSSTDTSADASGAFSGVSLTIPNLPSGLYLVLAVGQTSGQVAFTYLYISALNPTASPSAWYVQPGSTLTWSGSGFAPGEPVTISRGTTQIASFNADAGGSFADAGGSVVPPTLRGTTQSYTVHGSTSGTTLTYVLAIADLYPFASPTAWYILPGSSVTFSGGGYAPGEGITVFLGDDTSALAHGTADASGNFLITGSVTIPFGTGVANYRVVGDTSGASALVPITRANFYPSLAPSAYYSAPGSFITLGGSGFAPDEDVVIAIGSTTAGSTHTDATGAFSGFSLHLPAAPNTLPIISGVGARSAAIANFTMAIGAYYSWINLSSWYGNGGTPEIISGHNFAAGETVTAVSGSQTLGTGVADSSGDVTINAMVPFAAPGPATIVATGGTSGASGSATMTVAPVYTDLQLGSYAGAPGAAVRFIGHGYLPDEPIRVTTDRTGSTVVASFTADATGSFDDSTYHTPTDFTMGPLTLTVSSHHSFDTKSIIYFVTGQ